MQEMMQSAQSTSSLHSQRHSTSSLNMKEFDPFLKVVVVGDANVGKTFFLSWFMANKLPDIIEPTMFDSHSKQMTVDNRDYDMTIWDLAGAHERKKVRAFAYPKTDVFLICYAVDDRESFENVFKKWVPEVRKHCASAPIVLIGMKRDLKPKVPDPVKYKEGENLKMQIRAAAFFECSVRNRNNLNVIFEEAVRVAMKWKLYHRRNSCIVS